jgi:hypothetical protein
MAWRIENNGFQFYPPPPLRNEKGHQHSLKRHRDVGFADDDSESDSQEMPASARPNKKNRQFIGGSDTNGTSFPNSIPPHSTRKRSRSDDEDGYLNDNKARAPKLPRL